MLKEEVLTLKKSGCADRYLPMSAFNGMRIVMSCENVNGAFVINGLQSQNLDNTSAESTIASVQIVDPTFLLE